MLSVAPVGAEFQVNTVVAGNQDLPTAAMNAGGDFVVAWQSFGQDGDKFGIYAQRFNAAGVPQAAEFRINTFTADDQVRPSVAIDAGGNFVVAWTSYAQDGSGHAVYAQRYNAAGEPQGDEFRVNISTLNDQHDPSVAMDADGDFVIAWSTIHESPWDIYARRYNAAGVPQTGEFRVNTFTDGNQMFPTAAMDAAGDFVIAWASELQDGSGWGIYAQRYDAAGAPQGGQFPVNVFTAGNQLYPRAGMAAGGEFVIAWESEGQDGSGLGIYARSYDAAGVPQGDELQANTFTALDQSRPAVAMAADGSFVITWNSLGQDGESGGVYGRQFTAAGAPQGGEFRANTFTGGTQHSPTIAMDADGDLVIAWAGNGPDDNAEEIYAQRFASVELPAAPVGPEFRVNTFTVGWQGPASVAMDADGDFVVVWRSDDQDGSERGIFAQRFDSAGIPQGGEFQVNTFTAANQDEPSVAMDADGDFVIEWTSYDQEGGSNDFEGIFARRFNSLGVPQGGEFRVNTHTSDSQEDGSIAMDADGDFVVAWTGRGSQDGSADGVFAQRYNAAGVPQGGEFQVNSMTFDSQLSPIVAMDADGDFVVAWSSYWQDGSFFGAYAQRYNAAGVPQGGEFQVNTFTALSQSPAGIAMDEDGDFVITLASYGQDGSSWGTYAQRYNADGVPQGGEFRVNTFTANAQWGGRVAMDADGNFVVTWQSRDQDGSNYGIYAQRYSATGKPLGGEFRINTHTDSGQSIPWVAMNADGDFVVVWRSYLQDGSSFGVYAQRYIQGIDPIVDNIEPGFSLSGDWASGGGPGVGRNDNVYLAFGEPGTTDAATWTFNLSSPGQYRVSATWFTNPDFPHLFTDAAPFSVIDTAASAVRGTALVNQKVFPNDFSDAGSDWEDLGVFDLTGSSLIVRLTSTSDNATYVVADAVRIERIGDLPATAEVQVTEGGFDVPDGSGNAAFGATDFMEGVTKTFTIANTGGQPLTLSGPVSVTGSVFEVITQPALTMLDPGQSTTFQVRMNATAPGIHTATVSFANDDADEALFDFTVSGTVLSTNIIDDGNPGFVMFPLPVDPGGWGQIGGPGREFDYKYNRNIAGVDEFVTWTFNVTPGVYRVSTTWAFGFSGFDEAAPFTIFDGAMSGGTVRGGRNINQKLDPAGTDYPPGFMFPAGTSGSTMWETIDVVHITGSTLTVLLHADDPVEFVLADSILIDRLGDVPSGPEIVVVENNRNAAGGTVGFGTTQLNHAVDKTFTITNSGTSTLNITGPISITGPNAAAFQLVSGPSTTAIAPGETSTFVVRLTATYEGVKNAAITFTTDDADEGTVSLPVAGEVLNYRIIDDQDTAGGYSQSGMAESPSGISYQGDVSYANSSLVQPAASATWTFSNLSPGVYYVALTWFDTSGVSPSPYGSNTPVTVMDGTAVDGNFSVNQRVAPNSFTFDGAAWLILGFFDFSDPTVTVTMTNLNTDGVVLTDGVIIARVGGGVPEGNTTVGQASGLPGSEVGRPEAYPTAYWTDDVEEVPTLPPEDPTAAVDDYFAEMVATGQAEGFEDDLAGADLPEWL